jgi:hypothetical protein
MVTRTSDRIAEVQVALRRVATLSGQGVPRVALDGVRVGG